MSKWSKFKSLNKVKAKDNKEDEVDEKVKIANLQSRYQSWYFSRFFMKSWIYPIQNTATSF